MSDIDPTGKQPLPSPLPAESPPDSAEPLADSTLALAQASRFSSLVSGSAAAPEASQDSGDSTTTDDTTSGTEQSDTARPKHHRRGAGRQHAGERDARHRDNRDDARDARDHRRKQGQGAEPGAGNPGDQILRSLLGSQQAPQPEAAAGAATTARVDGINDLAAAVAQRILVSDPSAGGEHEVRILLKGEMLGGTEVRITRTHGDLLVRLITPSSPTAQQIQAHAAELQNALAGRLNATVKVSVDVQGGGGQQEAQQGAQQRTGGSGDASGGDGRSRNRRQVVDEWDADDGSAA